jgi:hypothetical protein
MGKSLMLGASKLWAMANDISDIRFIIVGEVFLQLISCSIVLQLWGPFQEHISTLGGCGAIPFGI